MFVYASDKRILVKVSDDLEVGVYIAEGLNLAGLVVEAGTLEELKDEILELIPEMIAENGPPSSVRSIEVELDKEMVWNLPVATLDHRSNLEAQALRLHG